MRVLVADDEAPARGKLQRWLERAGRHRGRRRIRRRPARRRGDRATEARRGLSRHPDARAQRPGSGGAARTGDCAADRVRHGLRRARDQGVRAECDRLPAQAVRQGPVAARRCRASARDRRDGSARAAVATARAQTQSQRTPARARGRNAAAHRQRHDRMAGGRATTTFTSTPTARSYLLRRTLQDLLRTARRSAVRAHSQIRGREHRGGQGVHALVQGRLRSPAAQRQGAAPEPALQGPAVRPDGRAESPRLSPAHPASPPRSPQRCCRPAHARRQAPSRT